MRFSVIIPAYNAEATLGRCLQSVLDQTFTDFEVIVIDDGSLDQTARIAKTYVDRDERFSYLYQQNLGVSSARNCGISNANGEFIVFLDSDDRYAPAYLLEFSKMLSAYPNCDHFWCGYKNVDPDDITLGITTFSDDNSAWHTFDRSSIMIFHEKALDAALWNKVYRRQIIIDHQLQMDTNLSLGEDLLFNLAYLHVCSPQIVVSNQPLYIYTKSGGNSLDSKYRADLKDTYEYINRQLLACLQKWEIPTNHMAKYYNCVFYSLERVLYNTYRAECRMSASAKRHFNTALIKSEDFQTAMKSSDCSIHPLYRFAYQLGSWELIMLLNYLVKIKRKWKRA